jgi:transcriptional regulator with XRE-family HTH domain
MAHSRYLPLRHSVARLTISERLKRGWTQAALARRAGTTQARVSAIETGQGNLRLDTLQRVAEALGLTLIVQARAPVSVAKRRLQDGAGFQAVPTPESVAMMWPLAVDAWAFKGERVGESGLRRDVVRVLRGGR